MRVGVSILNSQKEKPILQASFFDALIPISVLICLLGAAVYLFGDSSSSGPNQIALLFATFTAALIGLKNGYTWKKLEQAMIEGITLSLGAILILLMVGALIGTWLLSGTVPTLIYYGLQVINPSWFYAASCLICGIVAMSIGSSWTTAATIGVALLGVATGLGLEQTVTAGAVISGAYFGDKLSPLSETTNLAPAVVGADLFEHIHHMLWTTVPSFVIALIIFIFMGFNATASSEAGRIDEITAILQQNFNIGLEMLVPLIVLLVLAIKKMPAFPAISIGAVLGAVWAMIFQSDLIATQIDGSQGQIVGYFKLVWSTFFDGFSILTGDEKMDSLLSGGGMSGMLTTTWLIMTALMFGAIMEKTGLLDIFVKSILKIAKSTGSLITATIATCIGTNVIAADQYIAIVVPGRMFKEEYAKRGLKPVNLSRTLEDGGTITSPLIPWNTCGAYMQSVLLINPFDYALYAFFNLINPLLAVIYAYLGIKILRIKPKQ
ncbi:MAG: NhaC family Na+:H+ antiporter [Pseudoalteromonas rhizosphaerae]|jgi:NhaC family Na+:H+ antiporter|uniref:Na+/H+ antiporter NhaC n=1 Tax=Pseudoalteromonas neustonica TaxID=1840331 RepID=A0ABY3FIP0_9GAMM|nr:Na+/H+ antiporter NhaC [Pseudoalteromonas sp. SR41-4]MBB1300385.1 Na+/H+ antiporter NhaC [Pseudoalteromonas sp. SR44-8]MBB1308333.1 Na+/H+ antiporter NhaC [Pseudoalteromonas sp. SR41-8]MBB1397409.1 Na+/H+ antiporter NhaC [Pseudoalteromonas sp. SG44-8]MBB1408990.1 Na+/H+ antiporter NhaC [Pseudoalteromonas sp. SG44-17]MBB1504542.1 Na+/H+ antiporter NhaC [Pseudoalteromonas sp. SG41-1]TVU85980.1 Na+/H+ antiporter NhaC [Pseudoalteromonas neustonica]